MRTFVAIAALASILIGPTVQAETPLNMHIGGRVSQPVHPEAGVAFQWPGTYFESHFKGNRIRIQFNDSANIYALYMDGRKIGAPSRPGYAKIEISKLGDGEHTVRLERVTEAQAAPAGFVHFAVPHSADALPAPEPRARQIEFIGDSYTVGYGNTSGKRECTEQEVWATTDTSQAFGPLTAKHFNADYQVNAISGRGIVRNYGGFVAPSMPEQYPYVLFDQKDLYNDAGWHPQIIVIGLGTNDFTTPLHDGEKWKTRDELHADYEATYVKFVQELRAKNPGAFFILMASDGAAGEIQAEVQKVMAQLNAAGESRIAFLPMNGLEFTGCNYHPSTADDRKVADSLTGFIDAHPEVWQGR
ncbi:MAG: GDSL-type esterase/lipase family protein [Asticcacaulis sp.]